MTDWLFLFGIIGGAVIWFIGLVNVIHWVLGMRFYYVK